MKEFNTTFITFAVDGYEIVNSHLCGMIVSCHTLPCSKTMRLLYAVIVQVLYVILKRSNLDFLAISLFILRNVVKQPLAKRVALVYFFENQSKTYAVKGLRKYGSSKACLQCVREIKLYCR